jgi:TRAP-type mannitol/chloroaromatic compound transport system substrate-binding protein
LFWAGRAAAPRWGQPRLPPLRRRAAPAPAPAPLPAPPPAPAPAPRPIVWKVQSSFPAVAPAHISLVELAKKVEEMSGGRLKWEILPAGAIVPAFDILDAVHKGVLDGGYGVSAYWIGKHRATSLFGTSPAFGMDSWDLLSWHYYGGGKELYDELLQKELKMNVVTFHTGPLPSQAFGWFGKAPIRSAA